MIRAKSTRIDSRQKLEKAKENEKKRQRRRGSSTSCSDDDMEEENYVPKKRVSMGPQNGQKNELIKTQRRGRPRKEQQMKVSSRTIWKLLTLS